MTKILTFPAGIYEFGSIEFKSNMIVEIPEETTLLASPDQALYPVMVRLNLVHFIT
jgi:polygalacturonase